MQNSKHLGKIVENRQTVRNKLFNPVYNRIKLDVKSLHYD